MKKFLWFAVFSFLLVSFAGTALAALININTADISELEGITGVGPVIARRIIDYRNTNRLFKTIEEIKNVKGIGDVTFMKMKDQITIGDVSPSNDTTQTPTNQNQNENNETGTSPNPSNSTNNNLNTGAISAHSSQVSLSNGSEPLTWEITAGRPRRVLVGAPVILSAKSLTGTPTAATSYSWSFGDGTTASGPDGSHVYKFPGTYQVVLNGRAGEDSAVARTTVTVETPAFTVAPAAGGDFAAVITNHAAQEENLGGFHLAAGGISFLVIPNDTLIAGNSSITVPLAGASLFDRSVLNNLELDSPANAKVAVANLDAGRPSGRPASETAAAAMVPAHNLEARLPSGSLASIAPKSQAATATATTTSVVELKASLTWWQKFLDWLKS